MHVYIERLLMGGAIVVVVVGHPDPFASRAGVTPSVQQPYRCPQLNGWFGAVAEKSS